MVAFVISKGLDNDGQTHRYLGFNNPSPTPGSPNYGYEQWITVGPEVEPDNDIKIKQFGGGLYAITRCKLERITEAWQELAAWREKSPYGFGHHQWLEDSLTPPLEGEITGEAEFDLYLPIAE